MSEEQLRVQPALPGDEAELVEPCGRSDGEVGPAEVGEELAAPEGERVAEERVDRLDLSSLARHSWPCCRSSSNRSASTSEGSASST